MIFGVGNVPQEMKNKTSLFRIMPTRLLGFSKVQQRFVKDKELIGNKSRDPSMKNSDL